MPFNQNAKYTFLYKLGLFQIHFLTYSKKLIRVDDFATKQTRKDIDPEILL